MKIPPDPHTLQAARARMQGSLTATILCAGWMAGLDTVPACMKDEDIRPFLGHALLHEIMPSLGLNREELDPMAMAVCGEMEGGAFAQPLLLQGAVAAWREQALPLLLRYEEREDRIPPCLCMGLACLVMLFAGVRQEQDGRCTYLRQGESCDLTADPDVLDAFSRLSCDMPPEMLSYAVLSDRALWETDLKEVPGLEEKLADQLRDLQLLGLRVALNKAWRETAD